MFLIAQVISCGTCCDYFPLWLCISFRTGTVLGTVAALGAIGFLGWQQQRASW